MQHLRTQSGEVFDADAVDKTVEDLAMQLAKSGEPFANVLGANQPLGGPPPD